MDAQGIILLDTTVVSFLMPGKKTGAVKEKYEKEIIGKVLALSFQSVAELWKWAEARNWGEKRREGLDAYIKRFLVFPYDYELAKTWARVSAHAESQGRRLEAGDAWIVSTAVYRKVPLIAHDKDMVGLNIPNLEVISYA